MKQFQIAYENQQDFEKWLSDMKRESEGVDASRVIFYMTWMENEVQNLQIITKQIEEIFPDFAYYGNESSGNISQGSLKYGVNVACSIFTEPTSQTELVWVEEGTKFATLQDLWDYCNTKQYLRAVELIPTVAYLDKLNIDGSDLPIDDEVLVFGGACVNYDFKIDGGDIIASGHPLTKNGMAVMLYMGEDLHVYSDDILGWKSLGRQMEVTKSAGKVIEEIDQVTAFEIYEKYLDLSLEDDDLLVFPLVVEDGEYRFLRTPQYARDDKKLQMFVSIPEGAKVRIAYGDQNTILDELHAAATQIARFQPEAIKAFSCAGRRLFWGDEEVGRETDFMEKIAPVFGFYTGGEILRFGDKIRVLNQTLALVGFREKEADASRETISPFQKTSNKSLVSRLTYFSEKIVEEVMDSQAKLTEDARIIGALSENFSCVDYVAITGNKYTDEVVPVRESKILFDLIPGWGKERRFSKRLQMLNEYLVIDEDKETVRLMINRENILQELEQSDSYFLTVRAMMYGEVKYLQLQISAVRDEGRIIGLVAGIRSVDEQKRHELQTQRQLEEAKNEAEAANRSKSEFLFNMSHDIRTPMNAIMGFTAMAKKYADDSGRVKDYIDKIDISGRQLLDLINQVLEMSRIETGMVDINEEPTDIIERFQSMLTVLSAQARAKGLDFISSIHNIRHTKVLTDETKISQIALNVVSNAMKYTPEGGSIAFALDEIAPRKEGYATFVLSISDTGIGMSKEFIEKIYLPFSREKSSTVSRIQGTGLGMTIVKKMVDLLDGEIAIESEPGQGTTFDITLDFKIAELQDYETREAHDRELKTTSFEGKRVLIVEDNEMNREIAKDILEEYGFEVEEAEDGDDAVRMCYAIADRGDFRYYDFILMDIQMPRMNGYEATRAIRAIPKPDDVHTPIIAMTANAFEEDRRNAFKAGMDEHLAKPIDITKLLETFSKFS